MLELGKHWDFRPITMPLLVTKKQICRLQSSRGTGVWKLDGAARKRCYLESLGSFRWDPSTSVHIKYVVDNVLGLAEAKERL